MCEEACQTFIRYYCFTFVLRIESQCQTCVGSVAFLLSFWALLPRKVLMTDCHASRISYAILIFMFDFLSHGCRVFCASWLFTTFLVDFYFDKVPDIFLIIFYFVLNFYFVDVHSIVCLFAWRRRRRRCARDEWHVGGGG